jgi:antitoxin VapB
MGIYMQHARVFQSGNSQAVRLPKEFRLDVDQVEIFRRGDEIVLRPMPESAVLIFDALADFPADFMADGRNDTPPQEREPI